MSKIIILNVFQYGDIIVLSGCEINIHDIKSVFTEPV